MNRKRLAVLWPLLALVTSAQAQEDPIVRAEVTPATVNVGEAVELQVTVLVPTWFARPPVYPSFELANAITRLPPDSSYPTSERIGRETWSGIVRKYRIYPLLDASFRLSGETINLSYANPGANPVDVDVAIPDLAFRSVVPDGARGIDPYIAGTRLELTLDVESAVDELAVGDAVVLRYAAELDGLPAIFLPPLAPSLKFEGVSIYTDEPEIEDTATARRRETVTLVFDSGGEFEIPTVQLSFWNTATQTIDRASVAGRVFRVNGPVALPMPADEGEVGLTRGVLLFLVCGIALGVLGRGLIRDLGHRYREAMRRRRESEAAAFRRFIGSVRRGTPAAMYAELLNWMDCAGASRGARGFTREFGSERLARELDVLLATLYGESQNAIDRPAIRSGYVELRRRFLARSAPALSGMLPPLNP